MANHSHIFLQDGGAEPIEFTPRPVQIAPSQLPQRDVQEHGDALRNQYEGSIEVILSQLQQRREADLPVANGFYLDMELKGKNPPLESLDGVRGAHLMCVNQSEVDGESFVASVFLPSEKRNWLTKKIEEYQEPVAEGANPRHKKLIDSIDSIVQSTVRSLFPDKREYDGLQPNSVGTFELWLDVTEDARIENVKHILGLIGIELAQPNALKFEHVTVLLVNATKEALNDIPFSLDEIEAIRLYYNPAVLLESDAEAREWEQLILEDVVVNQNEDSVIVGVLDGGVNNGHPLLQAFLPDERRATVLPNTNVFHEGDHGTGMAGLVAYGDLSDFLGRRGHLEINHCLASVKILTRVENDKKLYGKITSDAIEAAERLGASITCMAVTEDHERNDGSPSSWSAAIDNALYNEGLCNRVMVVSAGNTILQDIDAADYKTSLVYSSIQSPAQSLNAVIVGAYTRRTVCQTPGFAPIAPPCGISPHSRTSWLWRRSSIKPDIVMEGGNVASHPILGNIALPELGLVTTCPDFNQEPLMEFNATSAATALAARLAARIQTANPYISALSVRALMTHSANWTDEMKSLGNKPSDIVKYCGYGVPDEQKAMASSDTNATFIVENELIPFNEDGSYRQMHFYALPWPKELLLQMNEETVKLRVTLSYYIEPSPGFKNAFDRYRYASAGLAFDVKTPSESREQFIARKNLKEHVAELSKNDVDRWAIGIQLRGNSTLQTDWFECTARELAECNEIGIYPRKGWWKYRKIENIHNRIKYSLVVSIETTATEVYNAVRIAVDNVVPVEV